MKLKDLKFWKASPRDATRLKKYLEKEFPEACFMSTTPGNIKMTDGKIVIDQSYHNWILTMANEYQMDDIFSWRSENPVTGLIEGTKEFKDQGRREEHYCVEPDEIIRQNDIDEISRDY